MQSPASSSSIQEVEMFTRENPANPPQGNLLDSALGQDVLSVNTSHWPNQPGMQRQELSSHPEEPRQDSFIEVILGEMEEVS